MFDEGQGIHAIYDACEPKPSARDKRSTERG